MEPADQRRDDVATGSVGTSGADLPQWSPPTSGGTTWPFVPVHR